MNIIFITRGYPPCLGGSEIQARRLAHGLATRGHSVTVAAYATADAPAGESVDGNVRLVRIDTGGPRKLAPLLTLWRLHRTLLQHARSADALLCFMANETTAAALRVARRLHKPAAVRLAACGPWGDLQWTASQRLGPWCRRELARADRIVGHSSIYANDLHRFGLPNDRLVVIPNAVDDALLDLPRPIGSPGNRLLWMGRLHEKKNPLLLPEIVCKLVARGGDPQVDVVGSGPLDGSLRREIATHGLSDRIHLHGYRDDVRPFLQQADVFLLTSRGEGMPNALLEAMAAGLACVAASVDTAPELIDDGTDGQLVPPNDPEAFAAAIHGLLDRPARARELGRLARERIRRRHHPSVMIDRYESMFGDMLS